MSMSSISSPNKKRKLSPTPSSPTLSTTGPSIGLIPASASSPQPQSQFDGLPSFPNGLLGETGSGLENVGGDTPPSRAESVSTDATPGSALPAGDVIARRTEMRKPTLVVGSGDGQGYGDECFLWTDWPVQPGTSPSRSDKML